jgi:hypothetical protein
MKRYSEIVFILSLTIWILASGTKGIKSGVENDRNFLSEKNFDTSDYIRILKLDSFNLQILPPSSGVQFYKNGIVFLSPSKNERKMFPQHVSFGSIEAYFATPGDSVLGNHFIFSPSESFSYPCEALTFNSDFSTMFFTKIPKKGTREKIYQAKFTSSLKNKSGWLSEKLPLSFCTGNFIYSHPTLSPDGDILIFASDKEDSFGGMDLFISRKEGDNWSAPENLGKLINTTGNDFFPFLDSKNNLYYSSDGLPGYGGYDIFTCKFNGETWDKPINLSSRFNSENDEIAFTISRQDEKTAFFTRRIKSDENKLQLFRIKLKKDLADNNQLTLSYVFNGDPVPRLIIIAEKPDTVIKTEEPKTEITEKVIAITPEVAKELPEKKEELKAPESVPVKSEIKIKPPAVNAVTIIPTIPTPAEQKDVVIYRVQYLSTISPQKNKYLILEGESYKIYEYFYLGEYRYTVGEFTVLAPAVELQRICRLSGYQAFVAAFKNDTRSLDLKLFK